MKINNKMRSKITTKISNKKRMSNSLINRKKIKNMLIKIKNKTSNNNKLKNNNKKKTYEQAQDQAVNIYLMLYLDNL